MTSFLSNLLEYYEHATDVSSTTSDTTSATQSSDNGDVNSNTGLSPLIGFIFPLLAISVIRRKIFVID